MFEAYSTIPRLFKQHRRRLVGGTVGAFIKDFVRSKQKNDLPDAGTIIRTECRENPFWLEEYCRQRIAKAGFWVVPPSWIFYGMTQLRRLNWWKRIVRLPPVLAAMVWKAMVAVSANRAFRSGGYASVWTNMPNTRMISQSAVENPPYQDSISSSVDDHLVNKD